MPKTCAKTTRTTSETRSHVRNKPSSQGIIRKDAIIISVCKGIDAYVNQSVSQSGPRSHPIHPNLPGRAPILCLSKGVNLPPYLQVSHRPLILCPRPHSRNEMSDPSFFLSFRFHIPKRKTKVGRKTTTTAMMI